MPAYDVIDWLSPDSAFCSQLSTSNDDSLEIVSMPKTFDFQLFNSNLFRSEASSEEEPIKANCRRVFSSHSFSFFSAACIPSQAPAQKVRKAHVKEKFPQRHERRHLEI